MDTILNFRRLMIDEKIKSMMGDLDQDDDQRLETMSQIKDHLNLHRYLGKRLNRVI
jgi:hypothetical protein